jgi:transposase
MQKNNKSRKKYTAEFKKDAIQLLEKTGRSCSSIEKDLGIGQGILSRWIKEFQSDPKESFRGNGKLSERDEEMRLLRREVEILRTERDILKKAVAIFSRTPNISMHS